MSAESDLKRLLDAGFYVTIWPQPNGTLSGRMESMPDADHYTYCNKLRGNDLAEFAASGVTWWFEDDVETTDDEDGELGHGCQSVCPCKSNEWIYTEGRPTGG